MSQRFHVKKGDTVIIITGQHKGKKGEITKVFPSEHRAIVKGVNVVKRHLRPSATNPNGILEKELPLHISNLAHIDPISGSKTRVNIEINSEGKKVRIAKKSGQVIPDPVFTKASKK